MRDLERHRVPVQRRPAQAERLSTTEAEGEHVVSSASLRVPRTASNRRRASTIVSARPSLARIRGAVDSAATLGATKALPLCLVQSPPQYRSDDPLQIRAVAGLPLRREQPSTAATVSLRSTVRPNAGSRRSRTVFA